jgi:hypothetical protein
MICQRPNQSNGIQRKPKLEDRGGAIENSNESQRQDVREQIRRELTDGVDGKIFGVPYTKDYVVPKIWGSVSDNVPREVIIGIDKHVYRRAVALAQHSNQRRRFYGEGIIDLGGYYAYPTSVRKHPSNVGYRVQFAVSTTLPDGVPLLRVLIEDWQYVPDKRPDGKDASDGSIAFEEISQIVGPLEPDPGSHAF